MKSYFRLLWAEPVKYRRSAVIWLALGVPALYVFLMFVTNLFGGGDMVNGGGSRWASLENSFGNVWMVFVLPIGSMILAALACHQVQSDGMWRAILLQPVGRGSAYLAHLTGVVLIILSGSLVISAGMLLTGLLLFGEPVDWQVALGAVATGWVSMLPAVAFQVYLGSRTRSIAVSLAVGMGGFVAGLVGMQLGIGYVFPWVYPVLAGVGNIQAFVVPVSAVMFAGLALFGMFAFRRMDTF